MIQFREGEIIGQERAVMFLEYVRLFPDGVILSRRDVANRVGRSYSAVVYNLERAVSEGYLNRQYGITKSNQPGWLYANPHTMPKLFELSDMMIEG